MKARLKDSMGWLKTPGQQWWWQGGWNWEAGKMLELLEGCNTSEIYSLVSWVEVTDTKAKQYVSLHKLKRMVAVANCSLCNFQVYFFLNVHNSGGWGHTSGFNRIAILLGDVFCMSSMGHGSRVECAGNHLGRSANTDLWRSLARHDAEDDDEWWLHWLRMLPVIHR